MHVGGFRALQPAQKVTQAGNHAVNFFVQNAFASTSCVMCPLKLQASYPALQKHPVPTWRRNTIRILATSVS